MLQASKEHSPAVPTEEDSLSSSPGTSDKEADFLGVFFWGGRGAQTLRQ